VTPSALSAAVEVLLGAVSRGAAIALPSDQLRLRPLQILTTADRGTLSAARADQPRIARELLWRVTAMRRQIPPRPLWAGGLGRARRRAGTRGPVRCASPNTPAIAACRLVD